MKGGAFGWRKRQKRLDTGIKNRFVDGGKNQRKMEESEGRHHRIGRETVQAIGSRHNEKEMPLFAQQGPGSQQESKNLKGSRAKKKPKNNPFHE